MIVVRVEHWDGRPPAEYQIKPNPRRHGYHADAMALRTAQWFCATMNHPAIGNRAVILP